MRQKYVCRDKHTFVETKDVFVATKMILVVAHASDSGVPLWKLVPLSEGSWEEGISEDFGFGAKQAFSQADVV